MKYPIQKLLVASHNKGKVREIRDLLVPFGVETFSASELGLADPEETGDSFIANAELKAQLAANASGLITLADDSGLAVDALGGAPGIYSARWAEGKNGKRDFQMAMEKVYTKMLANGGAKTARFICALSLAFPNKGAFTYEGKVEGTLVWPPRGDKGFGYDSIFQAIGDTLTFAEIAPEKKHAKSHRADAFAQFVSAWFAPKTP
ncbi:MAG: RdgB/HAM1 family non-canonical purine NTP pyrophosphatase [Robiginitomaculum sp.]